MKKIRKTQEEEIIAILKKEGFREVSEHEITASPSRYFFEFPECIKEDSKKQHKMCKKAVKHPTI